MPGKPRKPPTGKRPPSSRVGVQRFRPLQTTVKISAVPTAITLWLSGPAEASLMLAERAEGIHGISKRLEEVKKFAKLPWRDAPQVEKKRRLREFLTILMFEGRAGHIEVSEAEEIHLKSFGEKLGANPAQITPEEVESISSLYKRLELFGAKLPQITFDYRR